MSCALSSTILIAAIAGLGGCAFVPREYPRLEEARAANVEAQADARVARFAAAELTKAEEALERARTARDTLDDPAVVDHLAYVARQRHAIARAAAQWRASLAAIEHDEQSARETHALSP